jgi:hypothetical protein
MNDPDIVILLQRLGFTPKKRSGEWHSNCPNCNDPEGEDRFMVFADGNAHCRRCGRWWSPYSFAKEFFGEEEAEKIGRGARANTFSNAQKKKEVMLPQLRVVPDSYPPASWSIRIEEIANNAALDLLTSPWALEELRRRGIRKDVAEAYTLGYIKEDLFIPGHEFGLEKEWVWIPQGIFIPYYHEVNGEIRIIKAKVRRQHTGDGLPKYVEVSGSSNHPMIFGYFEEKIPMVVESELDAIVILQEAETMVWAVGLGGVSKPVNEETDTLLSKSDYILIALDQDDAGRCRLFPWRERYKQARSWPANYAKSPGDMPVGDLAAWVYGGINRCNKRNSLPVNLGNWGSERFGT